MVDFSHHFFSPHHHHPPSPPAHCNCPYGPSMGAESRRMPTRLPTNPPFVKRENAGSPPRIYEDHTTQRDTATTLRHVIHRPSVACPSTVTWTPPTRLSPRRGMWASWQAHALPRHHVINSTRVMTHPTTAEPIRRRRKEGFDDDNPWPRHPRRCRRRQPQPG